MLPLRQSFFLVFVKPSVAACVMNVYPYSVGLTVIFLYFNIKICVVLADTCFLEERDV
jgi:hypothetical protein